jgi:hypothetical protein
MSRYTVLNTIDRVLSSAMIDMSASIALLIESHEIQDEVAILKNLGVKDMLKINALQIRLTAHEIAIETAKKHLDDSMRRMNSGSSVHNEEYRRLYGYSDTAIICKRELE